MKRIAVLIVASLVAMPAHAGRPCFSCKPVYHAPKVVKGNDRVIINNTLVGIPVPVPYAAPIAAQGDTLYGSGGLSSFRYGTDLNVLFTQAARFVSQAQQLAGQGASDFSALVAQEGQSQALVAQTIAQGQAAAAALTAARVQSTGSVVQRTFNFQVTTGADGQLSVNALPEQQAQPQAASLVVQHCGRCHNAGGEGEKSFSLAGEITSDMRLDAIRSVMKPNGTEGHMPKGIELDGDTVAGIVSELSQ